jgi:hypothetical protein
MKGGQLGHAHGEVRLGHDGVAAVEKLNKHKQP